MFDFSNTRWSQIRHLGPRPDEGGVAEGDWNASWQHLVKKYWPAFVVIARDCLRRGGGASVPPSHAEDVVQGFLATCLEKAWLGRAAPEFGRFRAFAFTLLRRYTFKTIERANAQKRAPGKPFVPLEDTEIPAPEERDDVDGTRQWVACLLETSIRRVRARSANNAQVLQLIVQEGMTDNNAMAAFLAWPRQQVALVRCRGIKMLKQELRTEIRETVRSPEDFELEMGLLQPYLADGVPDPEFRP